MGARADPRRARRFEPAAVSVFSFGMAHKIRTDMFRRLRGLLEGSGRSYALYFSNANHETAVRARHRVVCTANCAASSRAGCTSWATCPTSRSTTSSSATTFFAAFFRNGVRANNTSIASAMEHGAVVITNLDEHSPPELRALAQHHRHRPLEALPTDPLELRRISVHAIETARQRSWADLSGLVRQAVPA